VADTGENVSDQPPTLRRPDNAVANATNSENAAGAAPFAAYIAHELRNPLATQRAVLELALADPNVDIAAWREVGHDVLAACRQQERVLTACITLSRCEAGLGSRVSLDLADNIAELLRSTDLQGHTASVSLEPAVTVGEPALIEILLDNLLANAVRHNRPGGWIAITTKTQARRAVVIIENSGAQIPSEDLARLFEPFQQTPVSGAPTGLGLGLAVVKTIADVHGARLSAQRRRRGGLRIEVGFAATEPPVGKALTESREPDHPLVPQRATRTRRATRDPFRRFDDRTG
jgi:signal transduction histidine kinase